MFDSREQACKHFLPAPLVVLLSMPDDSPRPQKRQRLAQPSSPLSDPESDAQPCFAPLPPAVLLVALPALLAHPPNHRAYIPSLCVSLTALRRCLALGALPPELECRAWTGLAEIGMKVISGGLSQSEDHLWARGTEVEVRRCFEACQGPADLWNWGRSRKLLVKACVPSSFLCSMPYFVAMLYFLYDIIVCCNTCGAYMRVGNVR